MRHPAAKMSGEAKFGGSRHSKAFLSFIVEYLR